MANRELVLIVAGAVALGAMFIFLIFRIVASAYQKRMYRRLNGHDESSASGILVRRAREQKSQGLMARTDRGFDQMIHRTGLGITPSEALAVIALLGIGLGLTFYLIQEDLFMIFLGFGLGFFVPLLAFSYLQTRYRRQLQDQLPDAFYLMARSLRAGLSLDQAIELVGQHGTQPLCQEFQRCATQVRLGLPMRTALEIMADRVRLMDFNAFVSTITLYQTTGGNLAVQLDRLAAGARDRNQFRGYFRSATALGRITAVALGLGAPVVLLIYALAQPEHIIPFFQTSAGWIVVAICLFVELIGAFWLYNLMRVEY